VKRFLRNFAAAASVLLAVASAALWMRSYRVADRFSGTTHSRVEIDLASVEGGADLRVATSYPYAEPFGYFRSDPYPPQRRPWYALGFDYRRDQIVFLPLSTTNASSDNHPVLPHAPYRKVRVPYWFLLLAFSAYPARVVSAAWRSRRERLRRARGVCVRCAYDLRASRRRCPECGTEFAPPLTAA
jgi:hypothetical protein